MACTSCETGFQSACSVVVSIVKSGTSALVYVQNQGRNIIQLRRILLCSSTGTTLYLRPPPDPISWGPGPFLEPGTTALYYTWTGRPAGSVVEAQAEYVELDGRSRSCTTTM